MPATPAAPALAPASLADLRGTLRRRRSLLLVGLVLGLLVGLALLRVLPAPTPTATVGIEIRPTGIDLNSPQGRSVAALDVERAIVRMTSEIVLQEAVAEYGAPVSADVLREITVVRQAGGAPLLRVTVEHAQPDTAIAAAQAIADAYLAISLEEATNELLGRESRYQEDLDDTYAQIGALGTAIGELGDEDPARVGALSGQLDAALRRSTVLEQERATISAVNVIPGTIAEPASADEVARALGAAVALPGAMALGLLFGIGLALVADRVDRRVWTADDLALATGLTEVVMVGRNDLRGDGLRTGPGHRRLRTLVAPATAETSVLVTAADADLGSAIAAGLATAIAAAGRPVALIDTADRDAFGLPSGDIDGWLSGRTALTKASRSPEGVAGLRVLRGRPTSELIASQTLQQLLRTPQGIVVIHVPGGSESGDAIGLSTFVDHVVVVVAARTDSAETAARTARWLGRDSKKSPVLVLAG